VERNFSVSQEINSEKRRIVMKINSNDSAYSVVEELNRIGKILTHKCESLTTSVAIIPEFLEYNYDLDYSLPRMSAKQLLHFAVLVAATEQPWLVYKFKDLIKETLKNKWRFSLWEELNDKQEQILDAIEFLLDEEAPLAYRSYLLESSLFANTTELFGAINHMANKVVPLLKLKRNYGSKVVKPQRKRGYDDKGSRRPSHKWMESNDYSFTLSHLKNEEYVEIKKQSKHLIRGLFW
jgi:hypothetical protein